MWLLILVSCFQYECSQEGEEYKRCGSACPLTCDNPEPQACTLQCVEGCFCKKGLFRDTVSQRCVSESECEEIIVGGYLP